ncbi:unnamed protein product [Dracunculus medinensis]|uniref:N-terminal acetyltransferase B complex subunit MDM20 homolog n=1 Tax=Dracunculus medinensis TaxID=318479 RepID=A0A158Q573_DRAME|nr:unnamed protein product [Dracunculus medinensis]
MIKSSDQIVLERRLRPIYDAIDIGNNKKAIQEADKILKKHPLTFAAKVLKALALIRCDRVSEAWLIINEVEATVDNNFDESTLQALCHCFKEAYTPDRITKLYEGICNRFPKNEQYLTHLFMSYVRVRNYKMQQKTALSLYKEFQRNPYYFWNVMSIVMQAITGEGDASQSMLFALAQKMVEKMINTNSIQSEAVNPVARRFTYQSPQILAQRILNFLELAGKYSLVIDRCISELKNSQAVDDWLLWKLMIQSAFAIMDKEYCDVEMQNILINKIAICVSSSIDAVTLNVKATNLRGPYLARLMLISDPFDYLIEYIKIFHSKPCCFFDIKLYFCLLDRKEIERFITAIKNFINSTGIDENSLHWVAICCYRCQYALGLFNDLSPPEKRKIISEIILSVKECRDAFTVAAYANIAAHLLWNIAVKDGDSVSLYEIVMLIEWISNNHTLDSSLRIILCRVYAKLGAIEPVRNQIFSLDIKYVQRDTLGYLLFGLFELYGFFKTGNCFCTELSAHFDQGEKEVIEKSWDTCESWVVLFLKTFMPILVRIITWSDTFTISECLTTAYKNGTFSQIPYLVEFLLHVSKSIHATASDIRSRHLSACFAMEKIEHVVDTLFGDDDVIDFDGLYDNRDLGIIPSLEIGIFERLIQEAREYSFIEQKDSLKLQHLLLRTIASVWRQRQSLKQVKNYLEDLLKHYAYCKQHYQKLHHSLEILQAPPSTFLYQYVHGQYVDLLVFLIKSIVSILEFYGDSGKSESKEDIPKTLVDLRSSLVERLEFIYESLINAMKLLDEENFVPVVNSDYDQDITQVLSVVKSKVDFNFLSSYKSSLIEMQTVARCLITPSWL